MTDRRRRPTRFGGYPGRYVVHCHNLEHEDIAMMAAFDVVGDGPRAAVVRR